MYSENEERIKYCFFFWHNFFRLNCMIAEMLFLTFDFHNKENSFFKSL